MLRLFHSKLHSIYITFSNGLLTNNSTWCQNRGCICISLVRRTYGRIHIPATIILWSELFPKKRREKIQGENFNLLRVQWCFHKYKISSNTVYSTVFPHAVQQLQVISTYRINSSTRILQEILTTTRLIPCHPVQISTRHLPATAPVSPSTPHGRLQL